jgi:hypothetical protein
MPQVVVIVRYRLAVDCGTETRRVDLIVSQAALSVFHRPVGGECWSDALDAPMQDDWTSVTLGRALCRRSLGAWVPGEIVGEYIDSDRR